MKYLVLGSSGQVGSALSSFLRNQGDEVIEFDIVKDQKQDLRVKDVLDSVIKDVDFVFFLAFEVGGSRYLQKYQYSYEFINNNVKLMSYTFDTIKKYDKPFIFTSSQMSNMSYSPYGLLKSLGEQYTKILGGLIVKFWNVYGLEEDLEKSHVITDFILKAKKNKKIEMLTDGSELRQFLYADDCSECLQILSKKYSEIPRDKELHITSFKWHSISDVAEIISQKLNNIKIVKNTKKDLVQLDKRNEPDGFILKYWSPKTDLKEGISKIIDLMNLKHGY